MTIRIIIIALLSSLLVACGGQGRKVSNGSVITACPFDADSAYTYTAAQVAFGPRVPGSAAHSECVTYLTGKLRSIGMDVTMQEGMMTAYDGQPIRVRNIIATLAADSAYAHREGVLLCAHYDTRPWADQEENYDDRLTPILGANDGASGVGVLLEIARQWVLQPQHKRPLTIILFDAEDMGTPDFYTGIQREDTWCLGSQMWAQNYAQHRNAQPIRYGILLDMVGDPAAAFPREYYSEYYARQYVDQIWHTAQELGYSSRFLHERSYPITDDHYYINVSAGIPCVDLIHYNPSSSTGFPSWWHTHDDDMTHVDKEALRHVGEVVLTTING